MAEIKDGAYVAAEGYERPATALESVLAELRRAIVSGELRPGQRIMQEVLAEQLRMSRVPIREALHILQGEGKLNHIPNRGYYVVSLAPNDLRELVEARGLLEDAAISRALPRITAEHTAQMERLHQKMITAAANGAVDELQRANREFHSALLSPSGLPHFARLIDTLWDSISPYHRLYFADNLFHQTVHDEHFHLIEAVRTKDRDYLLSTMREHREHAIEAVIAKLSAAGPEVATKPRAGGAKR